MEAFILIHTQVGKATVVARVISELRGVKSVEAITGPYDVIVRAESETKHDLDDEVLSKIQAIPGVTRTLTCPIWGRATRTAVHATAGVP